MELNFKEDTEEQVGKQVISRPVADKASLDSMHEGVSI